MNGFFYKLSRKNDIGPTKIMISFGFLWCTGDPKCYFHLKQFVSDLPRMCWHTVKNSHVPAY